MIAAEQRDRTALRVVGDDGSDEAVSYAAMAARSEQVANWLRGLGVRRGDRVLLMLGNVVPLWEVMLAAIKLGAVIIPASTLLQPADLADRVARGDVRHVVAEAAQVPKFADVPGDWTRVHRPARAPARARRRAGRPAGTAYADARDRPASSRPTASRRRPTRCCSTSPRGPRRSPSSSAHTHVSYPVGHLSTMYWIGIEPGDVHLNISSPGWAKHAWSNLFAPWNAEATVLILNQSRFTAAGLLTALALRGDHLLRAADGLADADPGGPRPPRTSRCASAWRRASR